MAADSTPTNDPDAARWHREAVNPHSDLPQTPAPSPRPAVWPKPTGPCQCPRCEPCKGERDKAAEWVALVAETIRAARAFCVARDAYEVALDVRAAAVKALAAFEAAAQAKRTP